MLKNTVARWPEPQDVKLRPFQLDPTHKHARTVNRLKVPIPSIPGEPNLPYFLARDLQPNSDRIKMVKSKSLNNPVVIFAESGAGKTRTLLELFWTRFGTLLVCREPGKSTKNYGSSDLNSVAAEISDRVKGESDRTKRREIAEFGVRCVLRTRMAVKEEWEKKKGKITSDQWLLVQLHPDHFFGLDIFQIIALESFRRCVPFKFVISEEYLVAVDEAQVLSKMLQGEFYSSQEERPTSLRSLLSPVITAVESVGKKVIIAGTGLSMLQTLKSAAGSHTAAAAPSSIIFSDFPTVNEKEAKESLQSILNVQQGSVRLDELSGWLVGRHRFLMSFIEGVLNGNHYLDDAANKFVEKMTQVEDDYTTARYLVQKLENDSRLANGGVTFWDPNAVITAPPIAVKEVFQSFKSAAWSQCNGEDERIPFKHATALVECGLANTLPTTSSVELVKVSFEPLVLEAVRKGLFDATHLTSTLLAVQHEVSSLGYRFEPTAPFIIVPKLFPPNGFTSFESQPFIGSTTIPDVFKGAWRPFALRYGKVADTERNLFNWFGTTLESARQGRAVYGIYPDNHAGPDWGECIQKGTVIQGVWKPCVPAVIGTVFLQLKYAVEVDVEDAQRTVDPALFYHTKRDTTEPKEIAKYKSAGKKFLQNLRSVPVFRVVVWVGGRSQLQQPCTVEVLTHGREGSTYKEDLSFVMSDANTLKQVFGDEFFSILQELKKA